MNKQTVTHIVDGGGARSSEDDPRDPEIRYRSLLNPQYWRDRAEETRTHAERMDDPEAKQIMLRTAEGLERQAELLERARE